MLGLILDNIVVFLYRIVRTGISAHRSRAWPTSTGTVEESSSPENESYPFAEVSYRYAAEGTSHSGSYIKGFWYNSSAKLFAARFPPGRQIVIRYRPDYPAESFLREADQPISKAEHMQTDPKTTS